MSNLDNYNYWGDPRVIESMTGKAFQVVESDAHNTVVQLNDDIVDALIEDGILEKGHDGNITVTTVFVVCSTCNGSGKVVNPSIDAGGLSRRDFEEDPEFAEDYFSGYYDIQCPECKGRNVVPDVKFEAEISKAVESWERAEADYVWLCASERRMGC